MLTSDLSFKSILLGITQLSSKYKLPFAFYRMPHTNEIRAILGTKTQTNYSLQHNTLKDGFVVSPFNNFNNTASYFINSVIEFSSEKNSLEIKLNEPEVQQYVNEILATAKQYRNGHRKATEFDEEIPSDSILSESYIDLVNKAKNKINDGKFKKVVVAQSREVCIPENFNSLDLYLNIEGKYPGAFVSLIYSPEFGTWIGATPEKLIGLENNWIEVVSLAGTKRLAGKEVNWSAKEYVEQKLVTEYIEQRFKEAGINNYLLTGPVSIKAAKVLHLQTSITSEIKNNKSLNYLFNVLHPTPAIAGDPKLETIEFIDKNEGFNRELYTGYIGPTFSSKKAQLFVNIRCLQLNDSYVTLYSGAGITQDSVAENENEEIEIKLQTMYDSILELVQSSVRA